MGLMKVSAMKTSRIYSVPLPAEIMSCKKLLTIKNALHFSDPRLPERHTCDFFVYEGKSKPSQNGMSNASVMALKDEKMLGTGYWLGSADHLARARKERPLTQKALREMFVLEVAGFESGTAAPQASNVACNIQKLITDDRTAGW
ncbi:Terpene cyclase dpchB [Labeo rohita]|uniref:Terpene cyclase dpchB n=1 Tax=Labeo rohita TaxID=84645 RepID=A0ABQ8MV47_LABRO|nr:Terpene cyclase dpchB [Labeo rohita]